MLPYEHRGNSMTASGKMEDFLPKSAGGKLKDKNNKVRSRGGIYCYCLCQRSVCLY